MLRYTRAAQHIMMGWRVAVSILKLFNFLFSYFGNAIVAFTLNLVVMGFVI